MIFRLLLIFFSLFALVATTSCAKKYAPPSRTIRVAVIDGPIEYDVDPKGEVRREGWWLGTRQKYITPNAGIMAADTIAFALRETPGVEVYSRDDFRNYMSQKERLLQRSFPALSQDQRRQVLLEQDPLDFGRSLNVDYVIQPVVHESWMFTNRTISIWKAKADITVKIWNVDSGELVWAYQNSRSGYLNSQLRILESHARTIEKRIRRYDIFRVRSPRVVAQHSP